MATSSERLLVAEYLSFSAALIDLFCVRVYDHAVVAASF